MLKLISRMIVVAAVLCGWQGEFGSAGTDDWPMLGRDITVEMKCWLVQSC